MVVIHYSGHGGLIQDPNPLNIPGCQNCAKNGTIIPQDATPLEQKDGKIIVPDIMGRTLFLLMRAIQTENLTVILDSCHSGGGTRGNVTVRAAERLARSGGILVPSSKELAEQERWMSRQNLKPEIFQQERQAGIARGVTLGSAQWNQYAVDAKFGDFYAGGFTYLLTSYLWQLTRSEPVEMMRERLMIETSHLADVERNFTDQVPIFEYKPNSNNQKQPIFFTNLSTPPAEAVITQIGKDVQFWLGGVSYQYLNDYQQGAVFNVLDASGKVVGEIQQTGRDKLLGRGRLRSGSLKALQKGKLLQEQVVPITVNPVIKVALDQSLGEALEQAKTTLNSVSRVEIVPVPKVTTKDLLLGQMTAAYQQTLAGDKQVKLPPQNAIGLFEHDLTPIADTFGQPGEPIQAAVNRLRPYFKRLLAYQMLQRLASTGSSSPLNVRARIYPVNRPGRAIEIVPQRAKRVGRGIPEFTSLPQFKEGTELKVDIENLENEALYLSILVIDADGMIIPIFPTNWNDPAAAAVIDRRSKLTVPDLQRDNHSSLEVKGTSGRPELLILVSKQPLRKALKGLQSVARSRSITRGWILDKQGGLSDDQSLDLLDGLLGDVNELTRSHRSDVVINTDRGNSSNSTHFCDVSTLAVLSAVIEVVS